MRKKPNSTKKLFNLDNEAVKVIVDGATINNMNMTEFIEFLAFDWIKNSSPKKRLETLKFKITLRNKKVYNLRKEIKKVEKEIEMITNWKMIKEGEKKQIISNLVRIMNEKRWDDAEKIAVIQSNRFGISAVELLTTALKYTNNKEKLTK